MAITIGDKIKQKNQQTFKLVDAIDIEGMQTGWQDPVKQIFADIAAITGLSVGDHFIVRNTGAEWSQFIELDIYNRPAAKVDNGIYVLGPASDQEANPIYLVTAPSVGMVVMDKSARLPKKCDGMPLAWSSLISGTGVTGKTVRAQEAFAVSTTVPGIGYYNSGDLTIGVTLAENDVVYIYVNGLQYTSLGSKPAISFTPDSATLAWSVMNAGFDLLATDAIELQIFNNE